MIVFANLMVFSLVGGISVGTSRSSTLGSEIQQMRCMGSNATTDAVNSREGRKLDNLDNEAVGVLYAGQLAFSLDLFKLIHKDHSIEDKNSENVFVSPMSIYSALLLTYFGSRNRTEQQLAGVLGIQDVDKVRITQAYKLTKFTRALMRVAGLVKYDLEIANRLYFNSAEEVHQCMKDIFDEELEVVDFAADSAAARERINAWVNDLTRGHIRELVSPDTVNTNTRMALVNAAYFKGQWVTQFKKSSTRLSPFRMANKENAMVEMMFQKGRYRFAISEELGATALEIPYLGEDVSFFIILPELHTLDETVQLLSLERLRGLMSDMFPITLEIGIPKFRMERQLTNLREVLITMGLADLFDASSADLSGFGSSGLSVDSAIHKTFIEVNEEGSEAAAATALVGLRMARPLEASRFICDRPFLFYIYDNLSESVLFIGTFENPK